jgi:membrane dipeptidase
MQHHITRRQFALGAAAWASAMHVRLAHADDAARRPYVADMHSHYGMFLPRVFGNDLPRHLRENGVVLLAWAIVDDRPWISANGALRQVKEPAAGEIWSQWQELYARYDGQLKQWNLAKALAPADIDAALAGEPRVLLSCESANFLEGQPERLRDAYAAGVRQLQLVHYIRSPLGDHQSAEPTHGGLTKVGAQVVAECRRLGIVMDLAHGTGALTDAALDAADGPMIWSHSWITPEGGNYQDPGYIARSLALPIARKIAARGGVVGLWCLRENRDPRYPVRNKAGYADEIVRMCDLVGPQHVAFGSDMEGVWPNRMMNDYGDLRDVVENLLKRGLDESLLRGVFVENYARVVKGVMLAAQR